VQGSAVQNRDIERQERDSNVKDQLEALILQMYKSNILYSEGVREFKKRFILTVLQENKGQPVPRRPRTGNAPQYASAGRSMNLRSMCANFGMGRNARLAAPGRYRWKRKRCASRPQ
jgi:hypothetical protein